MVTTAKRCVACGGTLHTEEDMQDGRWVGEEKCLSCGRPTAGPRIHEQPESRRGAKLGQQGASDRTLAAEW